MFDTSIFSGFPKIIPENTIEIADIARFIDVNDFQSALTAFETLIEKNPSYIQENLDDFSRLVHYLLEKPELSYLEETQKDKLQKEQLALLEKLLQKNVPLNVYNTWYNHPDPYERIFSLVVLLIPPILLVYLFVLIFLAISSKNLNPLEVAAQKNLIAPLKKLLQVGKFESDQLVKAFVDLLEADPEDLVNNKDRMKTLEAFLVESDPETLEKLVSALQGRLYQAFVLSLEYSFESAIELEVFQNLLQVMGNAQFSCIQNLEGQEPTGRAGTIEKINNLNPLNLSFIQKRNIIEMLAQSSLPSAEAIKETLATTEKDNLEAAAKSGLKTFTPCANVLWTMATAKPENEMQPLAEVTL